MSTPTSTMTQAQADLRAVRQQRQALRTALILASVAAVFFFGVILKRWMFGG